MIKSSVTQIQTFYLVCNGLKTIKSLCKLVVSYGRHSQSGSQHLGEENMFNRTEEKVVCNAGVFLKVFYFSSRQTMHYFPPAAQKQDSVKTGISLAVIIKHTKT